jgi:hypothetical protein
MSVMVASTAVLLDMSQHKKLAPATLVMALLPTCSLISSTMTRAPSAAKHCATPRPMPCAAPVTTATLFLSLIVVSIEFLKLAAIVSRLKEPLVEMAQQIT